MRSFSFLLLMILTSGACRQGEYTPINISGPAQGTTYNITYLAGAFSNYRGSIDSIFSTIDASLSTYVPTSLISRINKNDSSALLDEHFEKVFNKSIEVSKITGGLFDVTVGPIINAYGFGPAKKRSLEPQQLDSLRQLIGFAKVSVTNHTLRKTSPKVMLDFNAIAQGYTVDVIAEFLERKGIHNYLIELGGEIRAKGKKQDDSPWTLGIEQPDENPANGASLNSTIALTNQSLATSGNYKKFYVEDGKKYTHIINPLTGLPAKNNLLSASVVAADCMTADAYATAFIVMGLDKAKAFLQAHGDLQLEVFFIYDQDGTVQTYRSKKFPRSVQ